MQSPLGERKRRRIVVFGRWSSADQEHHQAPRHSDCPHDARDAAATTWAIAAPEQIGVARDLLVHSDLRTTIKHYNRAKGVEASRAHALVIAAMRKRGRRSS
jgi:hypothetical protein